jgi:hypothetical protein
MTASDNIFKAKLCFLYKRALETFTLELGVTESLGACFAAKLVRGAYLEKERKLDPTSICVSHAKTGQNYHR